MNSSVFGSDSQPGLTLLATGRQDCSDLHSWGPGVRPVYIIHYILRGQGFIEYHKKTFPVHTGESFLIYPYDTIRYYPDPGNPWEYTWVEFTGKEAASLLDQTAFSPAALAKFFAGRFLFLPFPARGSGSRRLRPKSSLDSHPEV